VHTSNGVHGVHAPARVTLRRWAEMPNPAGSSAHSPA
jgi:hypothetical protein